eukprot:GEMP01086502.1.p1 GENE.GEMP01086502.1~~GEMP01086502.1.p1  ORF type:complete len:140 (+),score=40.89 GEMP01086502.1:33-452(+)
MFNFDEALAEDAQPRVMPPEPELDWSVEEWQESWHFEGERRMYSIKEVDCVLRLPNGKRIWAHKDIISDVLPPRDVHDVPEGFDEVLRWIYCKSVNLDKENIELVHHLAIEHHIESLEAQCARFVVSLTMDKDELERNA